MASRSGPGAGNSQSSASNQTAARLQTSGMQNVNEVPSRPPSVAGRKHLPQIPASSSGTTLVPSPMIIDRSAGDAGFQPFFLEYGLISEYGAVIKDRYKLQGIYVVPSAKSALVWNGVLFVRQGIYEDGIFRFTVHIPSNFPDGDCPSVVFNPPVFHPVIDQVSGKLDVVRAFHKWRRAVNRISQVLLYARRIFSKIDTKDALNPEAADLYENNPALFKTRVSECIERCKESLYKDPDPTDAHAIRFSPWDPLVHESAKQKMFHSMTEINNKETVSTVQDS